MSARIAAFKWIRDAWSWETPVSGRRLESLDLHGAPWDIRLKEKRDGEPSLLTLDTIDQIELHQFINREAHRFFVVVDQIISRIVVIGEIITDAGDVVQTIM